MPRKISAKFSVMVAVISWSTFSYAADRKPIERRLENSQIMERVQLVGVIAGGAEKNSGIAVVKDADTGRTYAIKTGDNLPGVGHIRLDRVQRELAVFTTEGKEFHVRLAVGGHAQESEDDDDLTAESGNSSGQGLFETWYGQRVGDGVDLIKDPSLKSNQRKGEASIRQHGLPLVSGAKDVATPQEAKDAGKKNDRSPVKYPDNLPVTDPGEELND